MAHHLPPLPYSPDALEPYIDKQTMIIHHEYHHNAYVSNLNAILKDYPELQNKEVYDLIKNLELVPQEIRASVRNNGGGHANHSFFWEILGPNGGGEPTGDFAEAFNRDLGGFVKFQQSFTNTAIKKFGSGWVWLIVNKRGKLAITSTSNQDSPIMGGLNPLFGLDIWEHAYYLKYQNKRSDYVEAFWRIINWSVVTKRYQEVAK